MKTAFNSDRIQRTTRIRIQPATAGSATLVPQPILRGRRNYERGLSQFRIYNTFIRRIDNQIGYDRKFDRYRSWDDTLLRCSLERWQSLDRHKFSRLQYHTILCRFRRRRHHCWKRSSEQNDTSLLSEQIYPLEKF